MSNIQAAIGCAQMERIDGLIARKQDIFGTYREALGDLKEISLNPEPPGTVIGAWMPTVVFARETGITREHLQKAFLDENIDARVFFWPLSSLPPFSESHTDSSMVAHDICSRAINLPSYNDLSENEQSRVVAVVKNILGY
jgi:perosamine synthetase